jgi:hypothetical protein
MNVGDFRAIVRAVAGQTGAENVTVKRWTDC